jgi:formylglycine-generating enzyme required for sulfatase activity
VGPKPRTLDGGIEADTARAKPFRIDSTTVTINDFRRFVKETRFKTEAEQYGWSFVFEPLVRKLSCSPLLFASPAKPQRTPDQSHSLAVILVILYPDRLILPSRRQSKP